MKSNSSVLTHLHLSKPLILCKIKIYVVKTNLSIQKEEFTFCAQDTLKWWERHLQTPSPPFITALLKQSLLNQWFLQELLHALNGRSTMSYKVIIRLDLTNLGYSSTVKALLSKIISLLMRFSPISLIKITLKDVPLLLFKWMGENGGCFKSCLPVISGWISLVKGMILPGKSFYNEKT